MLTQEDLAWHKRYEALPEDQRDLVNDLFDGVQATMLTLNEPISNDDRAEALVAAITRYVVESQK